MKRHGIWVSGGTRWQNGHYQSADPPIPPIPKEPHNIEWRFPTTTPAPSSDLWDGITITHYEVPVPNLQGYVRYSNPIEIKGTPFANKVQLNQWGNGYDNSRNLTNPYTETAYVGLYLIVANDDGESGQSGVVSSYWSTIYPSNFKLKALPAFPTWAFKYDGVRYGYPTVGGIVDYNPLSISSANLTPNNGLTQSETDVNNNVGYLSFNGYPQTGRGFSAVGRKCNCPWVEVGSYNKNDGGCFDFRNIEREFYIPDPVSNPYDGYYIYKFDLVMQMPKTPTVQVGENTFDSVIVMPSLYKPYVVTPNNAPSSISQNVFFFCTFVLYDKFGRILVG